MELPEEQQPCPWMWHPPAQGQRRWKLSPIPAFNQCFGYAAPQLGEGVPAFPGISVGKALLQEILVPQRVQTWLSCEPRDGWPWDRP